MQQQRLLSLDVMRGAIMILLAAESCLVYQSLAGITNNGFAHQLVQQFFHHPWHGLRFWDLVQPAFMTMAGSAMFISWHYKQKKGISWSQNLKHIGIRCLKLFLLGTALHCVYAGKLVWELWNVLTQLSITTLLAYLLINKSNTFQVAISIALLLLTEILYRFVTPYGFTEPFVNGKNFGNWMDLKLMGIMNSDGWVAINVIPTAAHTIWGVLAGKLLISNHTNLKKISYLVIAGFICLAAGYLLDILNITPIIKRISTSSFVLVSGGWVLLIIAFLFWIADVKQQNRLAWIFTVVGMNAIFSYLFFETAGLQWLNNTVAIFIKGIFGIAGTKDSISSAISALTVLFAEWSLCYWLYKKNIFFKL